MDFVIFGWITTTVDFTREQGHLLYSFKHRVTKQVLSFSKKVALKRAVVFCVKQSSKGAS